MNSRDVIDAWDQAGPGFTHPSRGVSEDAYWRSGTIQAASLALDLPDGAHVIDFGCGDGRVAIPLHRLGFQVTAVDSSPRMLAALAALDPAIPTVCSDGTDLGGLHGRFDAAVCLAVLIHHDYPAGSRIVGALTDAVRPGGLLFLDWPTSHEPAEGQVWTDVTTWHPDMQAEVAEAWGLDLVDMDRPWVVYRVREVTGSDMLGA